MAVFVEVKDYPAGSMPFSVTGGKIELKEISSREVAAFNQDVDLLQSQWAAPVVREAMIANMDLVFAVVRNVMKAANQPYGGAAALGNEVQVDWLRPADVDFQPAGAVANTWDFTATGATGAAINLLGTAAAPVTMTADKEAQIHLAVHYAGGQSSLEAIQYAKGGKTFTVYTLFEDGFDPDNQIVKLRAPVVALPAETYNAQARMGRNIACTIRIIGLRIATADVHRAL